MSKDTSRQPASPQLITHPTIPFGMGFPFPVAYQPMGQFIPMGMVPVNSNAMQYYMELASKSGFNPMIAPMFGPPAISQPSLLLDQRDKVGKESILVSHKGCDAPGTWNQTKDPVSNSLVPGDDIMRATCLSNIQSTGRDKTPMMTMPSVCFLPAFSPGGIAGCFPNCPPFNVITPSKIDETLPKDFQSLQNMEQDIVLQSKSEDRKESDELDVARILVNMQVPVLKQIQKSMITSGTTRKGSHELTVKQDLISDTSDQNSSSKDGFSSAVPYEARVDVSFHTTHRDDAAAMPVFPHYNEKRDNDIENAGMNNFVAEKVDRSENKIMSENVKEREHEAFYLPESDVRPEEMQKEKVEDLSIMKLEVISEGESTKLAPTGSDQPTPNDVRVINMPYLSSSVQLEVSNENCKGEHLQELQSIKSEVMEVCSVQNPVNESTVVSGESPIFSTEEVTVEIENKNKISKPHSPEEQQDQSDLSISNLDSANGIDCEPTDELSSDENGMPRKVYKCDVCSQLFRSPLGLQKHIEFHMDDGKHFTCTICFMHFGNDEALQDHQEKHMRKRPHKCKFCPKAFRDPGSLQKHVRVHTGEKPYKCKDCPRSFAEYSSLRKHQRVHTGEQPYKCQYCSKAFSISGNLQRHILIHTGERPYKCNFCTKAFNNPSHLRRHVKNLHFKGDSAVDEAMLSHYGNPGSVLSKPAENESSHGIDGEQTIKPETLPKDVMLNNAVEHDSLNDVELASRQAVIQAL